MPHIKPHIKYSSKALIVVLFLSFFSSFAFGQLFYKTEVRSFPLTNTRNVSDIRKDYFVSVQHIDSVFEGNRTYRYYVEDLKKQIATHHYAINYSNVSNQRRSENEDAPMPVMGKSFEGNLFNGSAPNDNTMAISKDGIVVAAINTNIIFYDINQDSLLKTVSLSKFSDTLTTVSKHQYDPKAIYDYKEDKFILVYLAGASNDTTSNIIVAFSETNDPLGNWNFYTLPGDAVNDTSWSDYPAISLNDKELIVTINLLKYGGSWQTSFRQSVVWQVGKEKGYQGKTIDTRLYHDIAYNGTNIRNIHPVRGGDAYYNPEVYLLSNRNFALESDTFFLMKITGSYDEPSSVLQVKVLQSDEKYGMPANARQKGSAKRLATNDARVLGAFYQNGEIQFVGNSIRILGAGINDKLAAFYHGLIINPEKATGIDLTTYIDPRDTMLQYGYPNLSYCGRNSKSRQSIITVNYSSVDSFPGFGAIYYSQDKAFSNLETIMSGDSYLRVMWGLQRWGDYSGTQPMYGQAGRVWAAGTWAKSGKYATWITELSNPEDEPEPVLPVEFTAKAYPNPPVDYQLSVSFNLPETRQIQVELIDINGRIVDVIYDAIAQAGKNILSFSTASLENGFYVIRIRSGKDLLFSKKISVIQ